MGFSHRALILTFLGLAALGLACGGSSESRSPESAIVFITPDIPSPMPLARPSPTPTLVPSPQPTVVPEVSEPASLGYLSADGAVPQLPASFPPPLPDPALSSLIQQALATHEGAYSVAVRNLANGRSAFVNADRVYYAASLFKLPLLYEAYRQRDAGFLTFAEELVLDEEAVQYDLGTLESLGLQEGDVITLADALKAMIVVSDTPSAVLVQEKLGFTPVDQTLRSLGLTATETANRDLPTTARDMALLLEALARGDLVSPESREEMLSLLLQEQFRDRIPALLPPNTPVAHKTGNFVNASDEFFNATHDIAIVWGPNGPYVIAVLSDQPSKPGPIAELSRLVYDYFAENP